MNRVWRLIVDDRAETMQLNAAVVDRPPTADQNRMLHQTIQAVTADLDKLSFNTAIARMMEFTNFFTKQASGRARRWRSSCCCSRRSPRTWPRSCGKRSGTRESLAYEPWPAFDPALANEDTIEVPVQINGKLRSKITVAADADARPARSRRPRRRTRSPSCSPASKSSK